MQKIFLYDPATIGDSEALVVMKRKGYECVPLTADPATFWTALEELGAGDVLVLLSHGDEDGPLAVAGNDGDDIDLDDFATAVEGVDVYLLSCHTGQDPCASTLSDAGVTFAAAKGFAEFKVVPGEAVNVYSKEGTVCVGWAGTLGPKRAASAIVLP